MMKTKRICKKGSDKVRMEINQSYGFYQDGFNQAMCTFMIAGQIGYECR